MDELTAQLAADFSVSSDPNSTAAQHPRFSQYKSRGDVLNQNTRRLKILKAQKKQRFDYLCHMRCLAEDTWEKADAESVASNDSMEVQLEGEEAKLRKPGKYFKNQLMMSEWLVEVPDDFTESWCTVICPWGKRCLVVASRGRTTAYSRGGYRINTFSSHLPGGSKGQPGRFKDNAILDCLFNEAEGTYYVLDMMCWKNHPVYDSETEFRFYWLHSKFSEETELGVKSDENPFKFVALPNFACTPESIGQAVNTATFEIDGILFYHKRTHYTFGSTPLVVWLKPYMVPEILNIEIKDTIMAKRPDSYTNYAAHMTLVAAEKEKAKEERKQKELKMKKGVQILQREQGKGDAEERKSDGQTSSGGGGRGGRRGRRRKGGAEAHMDVSYQDDTLESVEEEGMMESVEAPNGT
ncbi:snurportin-1-like [Argopecten irradians]|uniref:snurportin-1-like n=1 Tax=Argopecten irradians TaxID=31199 RepID=UPI003715DAFD